MLTDVRPRPDPEAPLLSWANAGLEAVVLVLVLLALVRPRDGAGALLPLVVGLALPAGLAVRRLLDSTTVSEVARYAALLLAAAAWALVTARLCAPPGFWQADAPRPLLLVSIAFGGPIAAGQQPLAFWAALLLWWRGHALGDWLPSLDEALTRFRLGLMAVAATIGLAALGPRADDAARLQLEQGLGLAAFFLLGLLTTGLSRRREMAGGAPATPTHDETARTAPLRRGLAPLLLVLLALAALALAGWGADALGPELLMPFVTLGAATIELLGSGVAWLFQWLGSLWPAPTPPTPADTPRPTPGPAGDPPVLPRIEPPAWLGPLVGLVFLLGTCALVAYLVLLSARAIFATTDNQIRAVSGTDNEPESRRTESRGPRAILAAVVRLFRTVRTRAARPSPADATIPTSAGPRPEAASIRTAYRDLLAWAAAQGWPRRADETPDEFRRRLIAARPDIGPETTLLTTLYVATRYGAQPCPPPDLARARLALARLLEREPGQNPPPRHQDTKN